MNKHQFLQLAKNFGSCGIIVITGRDYAETHKLSCEARDAVEQNGRHALVHDAETLVAHTHDGYTGRSLQPWEPDRKFYAGEYVVPTSLYSNDYVVFSRPFDCASSIIPRFRFRCVRTGLSTYTEPSWPSQEGLYVDEIGTVGEKAKRPRWVAEAFSGSRGTGSSETGLVWEWISLICRGNTVVFAPKEFNLRNELTGDIITDSILDISETERPTFWAYQHLFRRLTREIFPYMVAQYYYDTSLASNPDDPALITFVKSQVTDHGCEFQLAARTWCSLTVDEWCSLTVDEWCSLPID